MTRTVFCLGVILLLGQPTTASTTSTPIDRGTQSELRASAVPVLLPTALPGLIGSVRSIAVISAGPNGYYVGYSPITHCAGALACAFFHVAGFAPPAHLERIGRDRPVRLFDGTRAVFRSKDCSGAGCTEASLFFARHGTLYELDAKVATDELRVLENAYRALRIMR